MNPFDFYSEGEMEQAQKLGSLACELKKKRDEGFVSMFSSTMDRYFRFFDHGRFLVYFNSKPKFDTEPKNIMLIDEVDRVEIDGKNTDFIIVLKNGKSIKLKHEDEGVVETWVKNLTLLKEFYKGNPYLSEEAHKKYKEKTDPRTVLNCLEELERRYLSFR